MGRVNPETLLFAQRPSSYQELRQFIQAIEQSRRELELHRSNQPRPAAIDYARRLVDSLGSTPGRPDVGAG
jgi:hypothetical protein